MESRKRRRGRPVGRSLEALEVDKLISIDLERSKMSGFASQADPQYVEILEREKLLPQRLRLRSTFAVNGDGQTREASYKFSFWFFGAIQ